MCINFGLGQGIFFQIPQVGALARIFSSKWRLSWRTSRSFLESCLVLPTYSNTLSKSGAFQPLFLQIWRFKKKNSQNSLCQICQPFFSSSSGENQPQKKNAGLGHMLQTIIFQKNEYFYLCCNMYNYLLPSLSRLKQALRQNHLKKKFKSRDVAKVMVIHQKIQPNQANIYEINESYKI